MIIDNDAEKKQAPSIRKRKHDSGDDNEKPNKKLKESDSKHQVETSETESTETEKHQSSAVEMQSGVNIYEYNFI